MMQTATCSRRQDDDVVYLGAPQDAALTAFRAANEGNIRAIDAMIAANRAALAVHNDEGAERATRPRTDRRSPPLGTPIRRVSSASVHFSPPMSP